MTAATSGVLCPITVGVSPDPIVNQLAQQLQQFQVFVTNPSNLQQISKIPLPPNSNGVYSLQVKGGSASWYGLNLPATNGTYELTMTNGVAGWTSSTLPNTPGSDGVYHLEVFDGVGSWITDPLPDPPPYDSVSFLTVVGGVVGWNYILYSSLPSGQHLYLVSINTTTGSVLFIEFPDPPPTGSYVLTSLNGALGWEAN